MPTYRLKADVDPLKKDSLCFPGPADYNFTTERSMENSTTQLPEASHIIS